MHPFDPSLLLDHLPFGIAVWCAESPHPEDLRFVYTNAGTVRITGIDERRNVGRRLGEAYPGAVEDFGRKFLQAIESGEAAVVEGVYSDDVHEPVHHRLRIVPYGRYAIVATEDVTAIREAERLREAGMRRLAAANAELDRFAAAVAHDLKTPLVAIKGFASMLPTMAALDGEAGEIAQRMVAASTRALAMIDDLLDYARHAGPARDRRAVDMDAVARWALDTLGEQIRATGAAVRCDPLPAASGDESALRQVFLNLLDNALKYTRPGSQPRVTIAGSAAPGPDGSATYSVSDAGIGIPPEFHEAVFDLGVRINESDDPSDRGSGIGLATCAAIVRHHGGRIWIEETPGPGGTTVHLTLPSAALPPPVPRRPRGGPATVFLIDDDPDSRSLVRLVARDHGATVVGSAAEGTTGLRRLDDLEPPPDVVVLDYRLPGDDGLTVAGRIRRHRPDQTIVLLSSHVDDHLRAAAEAAGIQACLRKQDVMQLGEVLERLGVASSRLS